jgi:hypothetical protein
MRVKAGRGAMRASYVKEQLQLLEAERALAHLCALARDPAYMADLEEEIAATRHAYVGSAVVEIAQLRAEVSGPLHG